MERRDFSGIATAPVCSTPHTWNIEKGQAKTTEGTFAAIGG